MENLHRALETHAQSPFAKAIKSEDSASEEGEILEQSDHPTYEHSHSMHDARRQLMESDEPMEVDHQVCQRWEPTGANKQPIGIKSGSPGAESYQHVGGFPSLRRIETPALFLQLLETQPDGLMYPIERYLPPAGIYHDQFALPTVFGALFFRRECCKICWKAHVGAGGSAPVCGKKCQVCGTNRHRDESCPLLYCNAHWYHAHNIPYLPETLQSRQMRPNDQELAILCNMGVLSETRGPNGIIVAQPDHPIVQTFYDSRPSPQAMTGNIMDTERKRRSQPLPPPKRQRSLPKTTVINSLDPRLQGCSTTMFSVKQEDIQPDIATNYNDMTTNDPQDTEDKLQEQEIESLKLRMDVVVKTREIRKLKAENDALKVENRNLRMHPVSTGVSFETGDNKPPWL